MPCFCFKCNFKSYFHEHEKQQRLHWNCLLDVRPVAIVRCGAVDFFGENNKGILLLMAVVDADRYAGTGIVHPAQLASTSQHLNTFRIVISGSKRTAHGVVDEDGEAIDAFMDVIGRCNGSVKI